MLLSLGYEDSPPHRVVAEDNASVIFHHHFGVLPNVNAVPLPQTEDGEMQEHQGGVIISTLFFVVYVRLRLIL